jgi:group I intron endonuclease
MSTAGFIYTITNQVNGKVYVGCTIGSVQRRWSYHLKDARRGSELAIHSAIRKYGVSNFLVSVVKEITGSRRDLLEAEKSAIRLLNTVAPNGYNLTLGGEGTVLVGEAKERQKSCSTKVNRERAIPGTPWYVRTSEVNQARASDPYWLGKCAKAALGRYESQEWRDANRQGLAKREANRANKDASLPPEELERRLYNRERTRRSKLKKNVLSAGGTWNPPPYTHRLGMLRADSTERKR